MSNNSRYHLIRNSSEEPLNIHLNDGSTTTAFGSSTGITCEIQHSHHLAEQIGQLLLNDSCSDVTLIVEESRFPAHKIILAARSTYFWAMFYGGMKESLSSEVPLVGTPVQAFKVLLKYIYCGRIQLSSMSFDLVIDVLGLVHKYGFIELEAAVSEYLKQNVCLIYSAAHLYSMNDLTTTCLDFFDAHALETLNAPSFLQLSASALTQLIDRNSFCAPEVDIFNAVKRWTEAHSEESDQFPALLENIRLPLIKLEDLLNVVRPSGLIKPDILLDALTDQSKKRSSDFVYRGFLIANLNVASKSLEAKVLTGDLRTELLQPTNSENRSSFDKFSRHTISTHDPGIIVELGRCFIINHIQLTLFDRDQRMYSYYVEVSIDHKDWIRVADYTNYLCRARQRIYFNERVVKYIRVVGTYNSNTVHGTFNLSRLEAMYITEPFEVDPATTLLIPKHNVATIMNSAIVVEGVSRSRNALLNGDTKNYDWDNGYTCHELGSSSIIVQLPQPYLLDSMRLLLWDCDDRSYSFYIEVSCDKTNWTKIVEVEQKRSWQTLRFERIAVVFVKIVGTYNSANEVFHCVHFECPAILQTEEAQKVSVADSSKAEQSSNENTKDLLQYFSANLNSLENLNFNVGNKKQKNKAAQPSNLSLFEGVLNEEVFESGNNEALEPAPVAGVSRNEAENDNLPHCEKF